MIDIRENGIMESKQEHIEDILLADIGHVKFTPTLGVGIIRRLGGNDDPFLANDIKIHCQSQGISIESIEETLESLTNTSIHLNL